MRAVTERKNGFLRGVELSDKALHFAIGADSIGRGPARNQQRVEILGGAIGDDFFSLRRLAVVEASFRADPLARFVVDADDRHDRASLFERTPRLVQFGFFEAVADERGDPFSFNPLLHARLVPLRRARGLSRFHSSGS